MLLLGSLCFYAFWRVDFTLLMLFSASVDYVGGLKIHASQDEAVRKRWLVACLVINFGLLAYFKYTYFIVGSAQSLAVLAGWPFAIKLPEIILPLGISFYTFHSVSYTVDVYRRQEEPVRDYATYVTFVTFWPAMMAGPILRISQLFPSSNTIAGRSGARSCAVWRNCCRDSSRKWCWQTCSERWWITASPSGPTSWACSMSGRWLSLLGCKSTLISPVTRPWRAGRPGSWASTSL